MRRFLRQRIAELVGLAAAIIIVPQAWLSGVSPGLTVFLALVTVVSLWVAARVGSKLIQMGLNEPLPIGAIIVGIAALSTSGLVIRSLELGKPLAAVVSLLFLCGVSIGLAFGTYGAFTQMKGGQR